MKAMSEFWGITETTFKDIGMVHISTMLCYLVERQMNHMALS